MKIDLHVHTKERSACADLSEDEQIQGAIQAGLDGIAITDHEKLVPPAHLAELNRRYAPFVIYTGIEVPANDLHWLVIGLADPALQRQDWHYPDLYRYVRSKGGLIILAHPYRYKPWLGVNIDHFTPDGIEIRSSNTPVKREQDIRKLAERLGMAPVINSDAHHPGTIGQYYTVLPKPADNDQELIRVFEHLKVKN